MSPASKSWATDGGPHDLGQLLPPYYQQQAPLVVHCQQQQQLLQQKESSHGAGGTVVVHGMETGWKTCWSCSGRFRRRLALTVTMASCFLLLVLYALTFSCCVEVVNSGVDQKDGSYSSSPSSASQQHRVVLLNSPEDEDVRFAEDLEQERRFHHHHHLHHGNHQHNHRTTNHQRLGRRIQANSQQQTSISNSNHHSKDNTNNNNGYYTNTNSRQPMKYPPPPPPSRSVDSSEQEGVGSNPTPRRHEEYPEDDEDGYDSTRTRTSSSASREGGGPPDSPLASPRYTGNMVRTSQAGSRKLPQAIIIGVKKGGTRALLEFLRIHPDVRAPGPEPHFFDKHYNRGIEWYRSQMPPTIEGQLTVEKTPSYFITKGVPGRVFNMNKKMKLIVVVRDPVTRAISDYTQTASKRPDVKAFEAMAFLNNSTGIVDTSWGAIRIGVYAKHLERWLKYFPLEQIHFVHGEKLISNPAGEMAKVQEYLGLKNVITEKHFFFNTTKGFPCLKKPEGSGNPHCLGKTKGRTHPKVDDKTLKRLQDFYRPFNAKFYQMTNQNFGWP